MYPLTNGVHFIRVSGLVARRTLAHRPWASSAELLDLSSGNVIPPAFTRGALGVAWKP